MTVVWQELAFVGGIDLAFGRFDTNSHPIYGGKRDTHPTLEQSKQMWPGVDYYNQRVQDWTREAVQNPDKDFTFPAGSASYVKEEDLETTEGPDRTQMTRMPWHDIQMAVCGPTAVDVARHFMERWNRELQELMGNSKLEKGFTLAMPLIHVKLGKYTDKVNKVESESNETKLSHISDWVKALTNEWSFASAQVCEWAVMSVTVASDTATSVSGESHSDWCHSDEYHSKEPICDTHHCDTQSAANQSRLRPMRCRCEGQLGLGQMSVPERHQFNKLT